MMPEERTDTEETTNDTEARPTITIAEKQSGSQTEEKPTITIAEKGGGK
jgi:hypothetical protein